MSNPRDPRDPRDPRARPPSIVPQERAPSIVPGQRAPSIVPQPRTPSFVHSTVPGRRIEPEAIPTLRDPRREPEPAPLEEGALLELSLDDLSFEAPTGRHGIDAEEPPTADDLPMLEPIDPLDRIEPIEDFRPIEPFETVPLLEGLEATHFEDRPRRPKREGEERARLKPAGPEFAFEACPSCQAPQPNPAPAFCEACGVRLRKPGKKGAGDAATKRCGECGFKNHPHSSLCTNCGMRL
jgi:hypothetical protein